jgi:RNA polymerase sigma-70 factor (ECF subfamily)
MLNRREDSQFTRFNDEYLRALKERNPDAENDLIACFSRPVQLKLRGRLRSPDLAQDASQETFLRVFSYFRSGKTLENPASLPGFVHSVCNNVALEMLRAHTRHDQLPEHAPEPTDTSPGPEGALVTEERKDLVTRLLRELSTKDRQLLRRVFLDEEDKDLVCTEFHVDRGYLRVLLHRARLRCRAAIQERGAAVKAPEG